jgi:hypothetical protein
MFKKYFSLLRNSFQCGGSVVLIRLDLVESHFQAVNDFRMLRVEVVGFPKVLFQVVELGRGIARFGRRMGALAEEFAIAAIALSVEELLLSGANRESARPAAGHDQGTLRIRQLLSQQSVKDVVTAWPGAGPLCQRRQGQQNSQTRRFVFRHHVPTSCLTDFFFKSTLPIR